MRALTCFIAGVLMFLASVPARAQSSVGIRGYVTYGSTTFSATESFEAITGASRKAGIGGGVVVTGLWRGLFVDAGVSGADARRRTRVCRCWHRLPARYSGQHHDASRGPGGRVAPVLWARVPLCWRWGDVRLIRGDRRLCRAWRQRQRIKDRGAVSRGSRCVGDPVAARRRGIQVPIRVGRSRRRWCVRGHSTTTSWAATPWR